MFKVGDRIKVNDKYPISEGLEAVMEDTIDSAADSLYVGLSGKIVSAPFGSIDPYYGVSLDSSPEGHTTCWFIEAELELEK